MTTRAVRCGNCRTIIDDTDPQINLEAVEDYVKPETPPDLDVALNIDSAGNSGPPSNYTGTTHEYYLNII